MSLAGPAARAARRVVSLLALADTMLPRSGRFEMGARARREGGRMLRRLAAAGRLAGGVAVLLFLGMGVAHSEQAWVGENVRLNLRSGPGMKYRILKVVVTGDSMTVMKREEGWTKVSTVGGKEGWIPAGYLAAEPPAKLRLARIESEVEGLRRKLRSISEEAEGLRAENKRLTAQDEEQQESILELTKENSNLKAGERWPYLVAGASILAGGILLGAIFHALATRRRQPRIRL
jgi:hypothetical protein